MKRSMISFTVMLAFLISGALSAADESAALRDNAQKLFNQGNFKDAYELFSKLALGEEKVPIQVGEDLSRAIDCLSRLNRQNEIDEFRESVISENSQNWMLLQKSAQSFIYGVHYGFMISGKFERGEHRAGQWRRIRTGRKQLTERLRFDGPEPRKCRFGQAGVLGRNGVVQLSQQREDLRRVACGVIESAVGCASGV